MSRLFSKTKDKILIITNMYPSKKDPIYGNFVKDQHEFLVKNGFQTKLSKITERDGSPFQKIAKYVKLYTDSFLKALDPRVKIIHYHYEYPTALFAPFFKNVLRKKIFITVHGPRVLEHKGWKKKLISSFFFSSDYVVAVSDYLRSELIRVYDLPEERVLSIHCGVDTEIFSPLLKEETKKKLQLPLDKRIILYLGRIHEEKGIDYYAKALPEIHSRFPDAYFLFVGNGPDSNYIEKAKESLPNSIEYRLGVPKELVPSYFAAADLFVFPTRMETFGLVAIEALAMNTPVVASRIGGVPEIILNEQRGFLFECGNEKELVSQIEHSLSLPKEESDKIIRNGRDYAVQNTVSHQMKKLIVYYYK